MYSFGCQSWSLKVNFRMYFLRNLRLKWNFSLKAWDLEFIIFYDTYIYNGFQIKGSHLRKLEEVNMLNSLFSQAELDHYIQRSITALRRMVYLERYNTPATPYHPVLYGMHLSQRGRIQCSAKFGDQKVYMMSPNIWNPKTNSPSSRNGIMRWNCPTKKCYVSVFRNNFFSP